MFWAFKYLNLGFVSSFDIRYSNSIAATPHQEYFG